jgi:hypothetical protein
MLAQRGGRGEPSAVEVFVVQEAGAGGTSITRSSRPSS